MINLRARQWIMLPALVPLLILVTLLSVTVQILAYPIGKIIDWTER